MFSLKEYYVKGMIIRNGKVTNRNKVIKARNKLEARKIFKNCYGTNYIINKPIICLGLSNTPIKKL